MIKNITIVKADENNPRNDTASITQLSDNSLMIVWQKFGKSQKKGHDYAPARIFSLKSYDGGLNWTDERMLVDIPEGDLCVGNPAISKIDNGDILLTYLIAHTESSSSLVLTRSADDGKSFSRCRPIWENSEGMWHASLSSGIQRLSNGSYILPVQGGEGNAFTQHYRSTCYHSSDDCNTWQRSDACVRLPMRGALEPSVVEAENGHLVMSLRTQLGSVFVSHSYDYGQSWTLAQTTGLKSGESCTCIRKLPNSSDLLLFFNNSDYIPDHHHYGPRTPLSAAISKDMGHSWKVVGNIISGDYEYTNLSCFFTNDHKAILTYLKEEDPAMNNGKCEKINGKYPQFKREDIDLCCSIIDIDWFYK